MDAVDELLAVLLFSLAILKQNSRDSALPEELAENIALPERTAD